MMLAFKKQNCELTLAEGLEIYLSYLKENNKKIGTDGSDDDYKIWQCHDCTHVIFGNGITFEEETINDLHGLILCSYEWRDYVAYFEDPFLKNHMKYLWKEVGLKKTIISMFHIYKSLLGILKMRFKMKKKMAAQSSRLLFEKKNLRPQRRIWNTNTFGRSKTKKIH